MSDANTLIARIRILIDDAAGSKSIFRENLSRSLGGNQVGGGNQSFQSNNKRLINGSLIVVTDGSAASIDATSAELFRGRFRITTTAPTTSCFVTYDFLFFIDDEVTEFLNGACSFVGIEDVTAVPLGLLDALCKKAASDACYSLATRAAPYYNASAGGKSAEKGDISRKYREKGKDLFDQAVAERTAFYGSRKGEASSPASGSFALKNNPYTPRR